MEDSVRRISIRNKKFEGTPLESGDSIDVVVVGIAYRSRMYYKDDYNADKVSTPTCWSNNTETPALDVPDEQRQSGRCVDCVRNIRGSGRGASRACKFVQRLAVVLEDDLETAYQLQLPPTSIFGDAVNGAMPFRAYARYLEARETPFIAVVTRIYFDTESDTPKLFFRPIRPLEEQEYETVKNMGEHADTIAAITLSVVPIEDASVSPFTEVDGFTFNDYMFGETYMNHLIKDVEVLYPRINKTYRFDSAENRSVPCDPFDEGAAYSMQFRMDEAKAKDLMSAMAKAYAEKREAKWPEKIPMPFKKEEDGTFVGKVTLKGAYGKEITNKPMQVDAKNKALDDDFMLTTGSTANIAVVLVPYNMREAGVSLRLRGVQVTKYIPLQTASPFEVVDGFTSSDDDDMFTDVTVSAPVTVEEVEVEEAEEVEAPVEEPKKKVVKQKSSAPKDEADLSAIVDGWDD